MGIKDKDAKIEGKKLKNIVLEKNKTNSETKSSKKTIKDPQQLLSEIRKRLQESNDRCLSVSPISQEVTHKKLIKAFPTAISARINGVNKNSAGSRGYV
ncbi:hypothetical protein Ciccas_008356 [Cichlidogyrus casuarinus]|uniref:Uncharacterized protein n=1 Tax=Cichlidogyrus casuarinus TaxID=1844966 RepID=A0ABD2Q0P5_9PLAT